MLRMGLLRLKSGSRMEEWNLSTLLLFAAVLTSVTESVINKLFNKGNSEKGVYMFTAVRTFVSMLIFILIAGGKLNFDPTIWGYILGFAVSYGTTVVCGVLAVRYGALSLTTLINSYSLMIPTLYGLVVLKEPFGLFLLLGAVCLIISIFCTCFKKEKYTFSARWILFLVLSFLGSGMCSTVQKMQQIAFGDVYSNTFMAAALGITTLFFAVTGILLAPKESMETIKKSWGLGLVQGVTNGLLNYLVILLNGLMPASVIFPVISGGSILMVCIISCIFFKEKLTRMQLLGIGIGIFSIIFFNL